MTPDFSRCRLAPFAHQREDVAWLIQRPYAFIASEMRTGKTKIVIDAAQFLYEAGTIDKVIVVAPAPVRDVWYDPVLGELAKHLWLDLPAKVIEYHARLRHWTHGPDRNRLVVYVTNYEFLRSKSRLELLLPAAGHKTLLVLDESSFVKNHAAQQTKACLQLRRACGRVVLLNGTPIFHSPMDLFSQGNILHPSILDCKFVTHFKARYAVQEPVLGYGGKPLANPRGGGAILKTTGWTNLDDLERRFAPYTVRRLQCECLDLPPKLDPVTLTATLEPATWKAYKDMRDQMVVWLQSGQVATSATAAVKALRLSQITGGFLGGVEDANVEPVADGLLESLDLGTVDAPPADGPLFRCAQPFISDHHEVGREKLDVLLWFIERQLEADPNLHLVAWGRFRAEVLRAEAEVKRKFLNKDGTLLFQTGVIIGGQKKDERLRALALLKPETSPEGPVFVCGIQGTGSFGLDFTAAHTCVTMSTGYSPGRSTQTLDRVYGPGMTHPVAYYNIIAVGPKGQHTIDRDILIALADGEDVATRTANAWVRSLQDE